MQQQDVQPLLKKYLAGKCTEQEKAVLETWYLNYKEQHLPQLTAAQLKEIQHSFPSVIRPARKIVPLWTRVAAAAVLVFVLTGAYFILHKNPPPLVAEQYINPNIKPGNNKAILTLANGKKVTLNDAKIGKVAEEAYGAVQKIADGQLAYTVKAGSVPVLPELNTLETPKGGQYDIVLSDGTKVWLNAASSLSYPTVFTGKQRRVELHGEGYFEVAKNKDMPFIVTSNNQQVEVLGTHFDISAYDDDGFYKTTLLEGSVRLNGKTMLVPGEQAVNSNSQILVKQVDTENSIAWKNGKFKFQNENIKDLMRKVARWYDVQIMYEGQMTHKDFTGSVSRFDNIGKILTVMESTNTVHFKIEGRRITVMP